MKFFLLQISLISGMFLLFAFWVLTLANGDSDPFYLRFTSSKQNSLILGTSRSAQGLVPSILDDVFTELDNESHFFNYSFTVAHSPYGATYLESIKRKLDVSSGKGIFILAVDPWSISCKKENLNDPESFREVDLILAEMHFVNASPNVEYLLYSYDNQYWNLLFSKKHDYGSHLHKNGWLEVAVSMDSISRNKRLNKKIEDYRNEKLPDYAFSDVRLKSLKETIEFLKEHGDVLLVRLPVAVEMLGIENDLMPLFNDEMIKLSKIYNVDYFNMTRSSQKYLFTDGNHLYKESSKLVSQELVQMIKESLKENHL